MGERQRDRERIEKGRKNEMERCREIEIKREFLQELNHLMPHFAALWVKQPTPLCQKIHKSLVGVVGGRW